MQQCPDIDKLRVKCEFIKGTDAKGCLVWLLGKDNNHSMEIMRTTSDAIQMAELVSVKHSQAFYDVIAFDIESDNSIGQVSVTGYLEDNAESYCQPSTEDKKNSGEYQFELYNDYMCIAMSRLTNVTHRLGSINLMAESLGCYSHVHKVKCLLILCWYVKTMLF